MSEISTVWERIEAWYEAQGASHLLNSCASEQAVADAEKQMGLSFPAELRESLLRHNGTIDGGWPTGELLSLDRIQQERETWMSLMNDGTFSENADHNSDSDVLQSGWWNGGWIPLDADGAGNGAVVDLAPGPEGLIGQVNDMDHEVGPSETEFQSVSEYLENIAEQLADDEFVYDNDSIEPNE